MAWSSWQSSPYPITSSRRPSDHATEQRGTIEEFHNGLILSIHESGSQFSEGPLTKRVAFLKNSIEVLLLCNKANFFLRNWTGSLRYGMKTASSLNDVEAPSPLHLSSETNPIFWLLSGIASKILIRFFWNFRSHILYPPNRRVLHELQTCAFQPLPWASLLLLGTFDCLRTDLTCSFFLNSGWLSSWPCSPTFFGFFCGTWALVRALIAA